MSRGKYLSLEEARKGGKIKQFCKEHPSKGNMDAFDRLFGAMSKGNVGTSVSKKAKPKNQRGR